MAWHSKIPMIKRRPDGRIATTQITNELTDFINGSARSGQHGQEDEFVSPYEGFWAEIVRTGPLGTEEDYSDERYWVKATMWTNARIDGSVSNVKWQKITRKLDQNFKIVTASNMAEGISRGHVVNVGQPVWVDVIADNGIPSTTRYVFSLGTPEIFMKITGSSAVEGKTNLWSYTWTQQQYLRHGQWQDMPAGLNNGSATYGGLAYNSCEAYNTASGIMGNSIDLAIMPPGFDIKPVRGSPVVRAYRVMTCDDTPVGEWQFSYENTVQGSCP